MDRLARVPLGFTTKKANNPQQTKFFVVIAMEFTVYYHIKNLNICILGFLKPFIDRTISSFDEAT